MSIRSAAPELFAHLVDDAAVFPPGLAPLDQAVREHLERRDGPYAAWLGPLLVPPAAAAQLPVLASRDERTAARPLRVSVVARPGADPSSLLAATAVLRETVRIEVVGVELGWQLGWQEAGDAAVPLAVEVGTGADQRQALDDLAAGGRGAGPVPAAVAVAVAAKFRTGSTPDWPWPDEPALARFLVGAVRRGLPVKLTGGLHHAVRETAHGEPMHGVLNVIMALHEALEGAAWQEVAGVLRQVSAELLVDRVVRLSLEEVRRVRTSLTAYGCCDVLEPLQELTALGLLA